MKTNKKEIKPDAKSKSKLKADVLVIGNVADTEVVRHVYSLSDDADFGEILFGYLDDCECDYDDWEVEDLAFELAENGFAKFGNHFFKLAELEEARA